MVEPALEKSTGLWGMVWKQYAMSRIAMAGLVVVALFLLVGLFAPVLANGVEHPLVCKYDGRLYAPALKEMLWVIPHAGRVFPKAEPFNLVTFNFKKRMQPERGDWAIWTPVRYGPLSTSSDVLQRPTREHPLGTDASGRDVLSRVIHGGRVSMMVGFVSVGIATLIGLVIGSLAGYFGGWVDMAISRLIEVVICFPTFFLILSIVIWLPPSIWNVMIVLGVTGWVGIARLVRGEFLRLKTIDYSVAAIALGATPLRVIFRHVLPNALAPIFVPVTFGVAGAILTEAGLSYLGLGVREPDPSWGNILHDGFSNMFTSPHMIYPPCILIFLAVLSYNLVGDRLRDVIDPRLRGSR